MWSALLPIADIARGKSARLSEQYLSLTGIITKRRSHDNHITPAIETLKADLFDHKPSKVVILHRREILRREAPFEALRDEATNKQWETRHGTVTWYVARATVRAHGSGPNMGPPNSGPNTTA